MCYQEISHFRCGHKKENEVRTCRNYRQKKAEQGTLLRHFMKPFSRSPRNCGDLQYVNQDIAGVCSLPCAQTRENMRKRQMMQSQERAKATAREYRRRKEEEERRARKKNEEEERKARKKNEEEEGKRNGKSRLPVFKRSVFQTLWETARGGTTGYTGASGQSAVKQPQQQQQQQQPRQPRPTREEDQRAPPARLTEADRRILPQPYRHQNHPSLPPSRTQTNMGPPGHQTQVPRNQPRTPLGPSTNGPNSNNRRQQPQRNTTENLNDRFGRFEANQFPSQARTEHQQYPVKTVTARRQVAVTPPTNIPRPSQGRISRDSQGPPPPVPPKNPWRPQHPQLAPAPLSPQPRESGARLTTLRSARQAAPPRSDEIPIGYRSEQQPPARAPYHRTRSIPQEPPAGYRPEAQPPGRAPPHPSRGMPRRQPVGSGAGPSFSARAQQGRPQQPGTVPDTTVLGYRPNPVLADRQGKRPAGLSAAAAAAASSSSPRQPSNSNNSSRPQPQPQRRPPSPPRANTNTNTGTRRPSAAGPPAAPRKPTKKRGWFKKLVSPPSSSDSSVEWVSQDAARIERGGLSR